MTLTAFPYEKGQKSEVVIRLMGDCRTEAAKAILIDAVMAVSSWAITEPDLPRVRLRVE